MLSVKAFSGDFLSESIFYFLSTVYNHVMHFFNLYFIQRRYNYYRSPGALMSGLLSKIKGAHYYSLLWERTASTTLYFRLFKTMTPALAARPILGRAAFGSLAQKFIIPTFLRMLECLYLLLFIVIAENIPSALRRG